jgi:CheY-like chemotaxis protein
MSKDIVIVDDEAMVREVIGRALDFAGYSIKFASTGQEALKYAQIEKIKVFLVDYSLPGMNGVELSRKIREIQPNAFIYLITGDTAVVDSELVQSAGFDNHFLKPFSLKDIVEAVDEAFDNIYQV